MICESKLTASWKPPGDTHVVVDDIVDPYSIYWPCVEHAAECGSFNLELFAFRVQLPSITEHIFDTLRASELPLDSAVPR